MNYNNILNIIDADTILFLIAYNLKEEQDVDVCKYQVDTFVNLILSRTNSHYFLGFLGGSGNFRKQLSVDYKAKRPDRPEFMTRWEPIVRHILVNDWGFIAVDNIEAEDAAIICANWYRDKCNVILSHCDKDLSFWEGNHYNYQKHTHWYSDKLGSLEHNKGKLKGCGLKFYYAQLLIGDPTDSIPNVKRGFGAKKAYDLLNDCVNEYSLFRRVYSTYLKLSTNKDYLLTRSLVKMLDEPCELFLTIPEPVKYNRVSNINIEDLV